MVGSRKQIKEEKSKCRKLAGRKNEKCESLFVCVCTTRTVTVARVVSYSVMMFV